MREREDFGYWLTWAGARLRDGAGSETQRVADLLGVSERTVRGWRQANHAPPWALRSLMLLVPGIAPWAAPTWPGWQFVDRGGRAFLCGPEGSQWLPDDLYRYQDTRDHVRSLQAHVAPGAQLRWEAPGTGRRNAWPGGTAPAWSVLETALRGIVEDAMRRSA